MSEAYTGTDHRLHGLRYNPVRGEQLVAVAESLPDRGWSEIAPHMALELICLRAQLASLTAERDRLAAENASLRKALLVAERFVDRAKGGYSPAQSDISAGRTLGVIRVALAGVQEAQP